MAVDTRLAAVRTKLLASLSVSCLLVSWVSPAHAQDQNPATETEYSYQQCRADQPSAAANENDAVTRQGPSLQMGGGGSSDDPTGFQILRGVGKAGEVIGGGLLFSPCPWLGVAVYAAGTGLIALADNKLARIESNRAELDAIRQRIVETEERREELERRFRDTYGEGRGAARTIDEQVNDAPGVIERTPNSVSPEQLDAMLAAEVPVFSSIEAEEALVAVEWSEEAAVLMDDLSQIASDSELLFRALGEDELAANASRAAGLFDQTSVFLVAYGVGDWRTMLTSGNALSSMLGSGNSQQESALQAQLGEILRGLQALSEQMRAYHRQEMAALEAIDQQIRELRGVVELEFGRLEGDAITMLALREDIMRNDFGSCWRVISRNEGENLALSADIEAELNDEDVQVARNCLGKLANTFSTFDGRDFGPILYLGVGDRDERAQVRRFEQQVLLPTLSFAERHFPLNSNARRSSASVLYIPTLDVCELGFSSAERVLEDGSTAQAQSLACSREQQLPSIAPDLNVSSWSNSRSNLVASNDLLTLAQTARSLAITLSRPLQDQDVEQGERGLGLLREAELEGLASSLNALDLATSQTELLAGSPFLLASAWTLDQEILPAFATHYFLGDARPIERVLSRSPRQSQDQAESCASGNFSRDVLCLMHRNPTFARNVIRTLVWMRLDRSGTTERQWRDALKSLNPDALREAIGRDIPLIDLSSGNPDSLHGTWGIVLPGIRVDFSPNPAVNEDRNCWQMASSARDPIASDRDEDQEVRQRALPGPGETSCFVLDHFTRPDLHRLDHDFDIDSLALERLQVELLLRTLCSQPEALETLVCRFD